ncbi:MAG: hypothetical protein REH83_05850, partial [Rickettsiella sp.]|nr:hypothetical protein [Rickettsiella sp.]
HLPSSQIQSNFSSESISFFKPKRVASQVHLYNQQEPSVVVKKLTATKEEPKGLNNWLWRWGAHAIGGITLLGTSVLGLAYYSDVTGYLSRFLGRRFGVRRAYGGEKELRVAKTTATLIEMTAIFKGTDANPILQELPKGFIVNNNREISHAMSKVKILQNFRLLNVACHENLLLADLLIRSVTKEKHGMSVTDYSHRKAALRF